MKKSEVAALAAAMVAKAKAQETGAEEAIKLLTEAARILAPFEMTIDDLDQKAAADGLAVILVDESGSMAKNADATREAVNGFVDKQKGKGQKVSIFTFDYRPGVPMVRPVCLASPAEKAPRLDLGNYVPTGGTPLYDAIAQAIHRTDEAVLSSPDTVVTFVIQTDGEENRSVMFGGEGGRLRIKAMIEEREAKGWQFIFMGQGLEKQAYSIAEGLGIFAGSTFSYNAQSVGAAMAMASGTHSLRSANGGAKVQLSDTQKAAVGDKTVGGA